MSSKILIFVSFFISFASAASPYKIDHLEPPFWWAGMADERLQILVHGERISELVPSEAGGLPDRISVSPEPPQPLAEKIMKTFISFFKKYKSYLSLLL